MDAGEGPCTDSQASPPACRKQQLSTACVHAGESFRLLGAITTPIFQSATFLTDPEHLHLSSGAPQETWGSVRYTRCNNNPSQLVLASKLAELEGAEVAVVTASGMAAISSVLLTFLGSGDHLLVQPSLYGGTSALLQSLMPHVGVQVDALDLQGGPQAWRAQLRPNTKMMYLETISNPTCEVPDLTALLAFAQEHGLLSCIDNTFASPANFRPLEHGVDLVCESATKYLNGHSDVIAGVVAGSRQHIAKVVKRMQVLGGNLDPHAAFLLQRGVKTLALRVARQNANALALATRLQQHAQVSRVMYPGLESHPSHAIAAKLFSIGGKPTGYGGVFAFELHGGGPVAQKVLQGLKVAVVAPSLGGVETLVTLPAFTTHSGLSPEAKQAQGITDGLVRVAVGIEDSEDLLHDFLEAIEGATA
ncbi:cystathionine beta-lyase MetC [Haematococcus lacustris]